MMERLEHSLKMGEIKEAVLILFNNLAGGDYFVLRELGDNYTYELVRKDNYGEGQLPD